VPSVLRASKEESDPLFVGSAAGAAGRRPLTRDLHPVHLKAALPKNVHGCLEGSSVDSAEPFVARFANDVVSAVRPPGMFQNATRDRPS